MLAEAQRDRKPSELVTQKILDREVLNPQTLRKLQELIPLTIINRKKTSSTMNSPSAPQTDEMIHLKNTLYLKVASFFNWMSAEQWVLLTACTPDATTRVVMADLLLDLVKTLSHVFLAPARREVWSEEDIKASLGHTVTDSFKSALDINDKVQCASADSLRKLINKEVADRVNSAMCNDVESGVPQHVTPRERLNAMVVHAIKMMNNFLARVKKIFPCLSMERSLASEEAIWGDVAEEIEERFQNLNQEIEMLNSESIVLKSDRPLEKMVHSCEISESVPPLKEKKERFVEIVIEKLFTRVFGGCPQSWYIEEPRVTLQLLFARTWAEVEGIDFDLLPKSLKNLDSIIFKDLCKKMGSVDEVIMSMRLDDEVHVKCIASTFRGAMPLAEKINRVANFFSSVGQA